MPGYPFRPNSLLLFSGILSLSFYTRVCVEQRGGRQERNGWTIMRLESIDQSTDSRAIAI